MSTKLYIIAYTAGVLGFITSIPQLVQIIRTEKVRDLNPLFFILHLQSDVLYLVYGTLTNDKLLVYSLSMPIVCNLLIFVLYFVYKKNESDDYTDQPHDQIQNESEESREDDTENVKSIEIIDQ
jgi:uncharacterized protein with PQ loop repeat